MPGLRRRDGEAAPGRRERIVTAPSSTVSVPVAAAKVPILRRLSTLDRFLPLWTFAPQPVRHWVATAWERRTGTTPESGASASGPTRRTQEPHPRATVVVMFTPEPGPFTIRFDTRPASGTLTVVAVAGAQASATARPAPDAATGTGAGDLVVLPTGVRVRNARTAASDHRVTVPATCGRVHVHFDASPAARPLIPSWS